jgi:hypothetical protein
MTLVNSFRSGHFLSPHLENSYASPPLLDPLVIRGEWWMVNGESWKQLFPWSWWVVWHDIPGGDRNCSSRALKTSHTSSCHHLLSKLSLASRLTRNPTRRHEARQGSLYLFHSSTLQHTPSLTEEGINSYLHEHQTKLDKRRRRRCGLSSISSSHHAYPDDQNEQWPKKEEEEYLNQEWNLHVHLSNHQLCLYCLHALSVCLNAWNVRGCRVWEENFLWHQNI